MTVHLHAVSPFCPIYFYYNVAYCAPADAFTFPFLDTLDISHSLDPILNTLINFTSEMEPCQTFFCYTLPVRSEFLIVMHTTICIFNYYSSEKDFFLIIANFHLISLF